MKKLFQIVFLVLLTNNTFGQPGDAPSEFNISFRSGSKKVSSMIVKSDTCGIDLFAYVSCSKDCEIYVSKKKNQLEIKVSRWRISEFKVCFQSITKTVLIHNDNFPKKKFYKRLSSIDLGSTKDTINLYPYGKRKRDSLVYYIDGKSKYIKNSKNQEKGKQKKRNLKYRESNRKSICDTILYDKYKIITCQVVKRLSQYENIQTANYKIVKTFEIIHPSSITGDKDNKKKYKIIEIYRKGQLKRTKRKGKIPIRPDPFE